VCGGRFEYQKKEQRVKTSRGTRENKEKPPPASSAKKGMLWLLARGLPVRLLEKPCHVPTTDLPLNVPIEIKGL